jgi:hypothetical protein
VLSSTVRAPLAAAQPGTGTGTNLETLQAFPASSFATDPAQLAPPDTQVAVGPAHVTEAVNSVLRIWSRTQAAVASYDLNRFFSVPAGFMFTDPRLLFDTASSRWFLSGLSVDATSDSNVYLAVSASADPTAAWTVYHLASATGVVTDQPKIGVSDDKLAISWNDFAGSQFVGQETWILQKSDLLAGANVSETRFATDSSRFDIVPVLSLSSTGTEYLAYNNTCSLAAGTGSGSCTTRSPALGIVAITGTPATGNVTWTETDPALSQTNSPPNAVQPSGAAIDTGDDRLLSAVWRNGTLATSATDACLVSGLVQSCLRLVEAATSTSTVLTDGDLGNAGADLYYPAITLDGAGVPYVAATLSSTSLYPSVAAFGQPTPSGPYIATDVWSGAGTYQCSFCGTGGNRWGDYSGAAVDPLHPDDVWVAGEYGTATGGDDWGTAVGELTFGGPTVASVSPGSGPTTGGTRVTVTGSNFTPASSVAFGSTAATSVTVQSSTSLTAVTPAEAAGSVDVTVTTADGTSPISSADTFSFTVPVPSPGLVFTGVAPTRVCDTRPPAVSSITDACSNHPLQPGVPLVVDLPTSVVPANAGAVVANVTVIGPTGVGYLAVYPSGSAVPASSNLNFTTGQTVANLVTVATGPSGGQRAITVVASLGVPLSDVIVDIQGYDAAPVAGSNAGGFHPLAPARDADTRCGQAPVPAFCATEGIPAVNQGATILGTKGQQRVTVTGVNGVPATGVAAVAVNLTVAAPSSASYVTVAPGGTIPAGGPASSNLNFTAGEFLANKAIVPVASDGTISVYNNVGLTNLVVDVNGWYSSSAGPAGATLTPVAPVRLADTRCAATPAPPACAAENLPAVNAGDAPPAGGGSITVGVAGTGTVPAGIDSAVLNVVDIAPSATNYLTVYPTGSPVPQTSDLNWSPANTYNIVPGAAYATTGAAGAVNILNGAVPAATTNVVADLFGYYTPPAA